MPTPSPDDTMSTGYAIRPMRPDDVPAVERLTGLGSYELEVAAHPADRPPPSRRSGADVSSRTLRMRHIQQHDPAGCWVAEAPPSGAAADDGSRLVGVAAAVRRDLSWILATFAVHPRAQRQGVGRQLLDAALGHGRGCLRGMLVVSMDPEAARRCWAAGFRLFPTMDLTGTVDRSALPVVDRVREGGLGDVDLMDSVDRQVRDAAHGVDHEVLARLYRLVVVDRPTGSGYAYVGRGGAPYLLAATNRRTATDLLWECLATADADAQPGADCAIRHVTAENQWAIDVGMQAGLPLRNAGYLALRGMKPPKPYLPNEQFL